MEKRTKPSTTKPPTTKPLTNPSTTNPAVPSFDTQELIRRLAYELYEQRGRQDGHDLDDWLRAESDVNRAVESEAEKQAA